MALFIVVYECVIVYWPTLYMSESLNTFKLGTTARGAETPPVNILPGETPPPPGETFNHTIPYENLSWCPKAECYNSPICTPCNQRFLFILATGRSGSTSLLRMFNQLPNVRLSGENYNILYEASSIYSFFDKESHKRHFKNKTTNDKGFFMHDTVEEGPFQHNAIPVGSLACVTQTLLKTINPPDFMNEMSSYNPNEESKKIIGAKMIRIQIPGWSPDESVDFFRKNFPCARYIINIRSNLENQLESMEEAFRLTKDEIQIKKESVQNQTKFLKDFYHLMGDDQARLVDLSIWKNDVGIINNITSWLGFKDCAFDALVHENHDRYQPDHSTNLSLSESCNLSN